MYDTHCHLNFSAFEKDLPEVVERAKEAGVTKIIIPGANLESSKKAVEIANEYEGCFTAVGIHPHHAEEYSSDILQCVSTLRDLAQQKKVVVIGETGLDYYQYKDYPAITSEIKEKQEELFLAQIKIACEFNLPLIVHCREAWEDIITLMVNYSSSDEHSEESRRADSGQARMTEKLFSTSSNNKLRGVFHCYSGGKKWLTKSLNLGFYLGIDGNVTYDEGLQTVVKKIPLDKLLLETDSPYLTPLPFRGERNEPKNIKIIAEKIAEIRNLSFKEVKTQVEKNCLNLFRLC